MSGSASVQSSRNGDPALELLKEVKALSTSGGQLPPFDEGNVQAAIQRMDDAHRRIDQLIENPYANPQDPYYASTLQYFRAKCLREKRIVVAYMKWRQERISEAWWEARDHTLQSSLTAPESSYLRSYNAAMVDYMTSFPVPLDLRSFWWQPPTAPLLRIRGLKDTQVVSMRTGDAIVLSSGKEMNLPFEEAERLVRQGLAVLTHPSTPSGTSR